MTKLEFTLALSEKLSFLPSEELEERLIFYTEAIADRMEDGFSEEEAVAAIGSVDKIAAQILSDIPLSTRLKSKLKPNRKQTGWEILLLVLGAPLWLSLGIAAIAVIFSLYIALWAVILSLWAVFGSLVGCAFGCIVAGIVHAFVSSPLTSVIFLGSGLICAGLAIFLFYGCKAATKGAVLLAKKLVTRRKRNG